jgi:YgiT-type zinc finger domain-containing protein
MECVACGSRRLVRTEKDFRYFYKGKTLIISSVLGDYCEECDEVILDLSEAERVNILMLKFQQQCNSDEKKASV